MLHKLDNISEIIKLVLLSAYIKDEEQPISAIVQCRPEAGKTAELKQFSLLPGIIFPSDMTAYGILKQYGKDIMEKKVRHILIPDMITPLSKRWETSASFVAFLSGLVEEGILEVRTYAFSEKFNQPVKCGIIGCITPEKLKDKRHRWVGMGFMSRMLPISWSYSTITRTDILKFLTNRKYKNPSGLAIKFPSGDKEVELPSDLASVFLPYTYSFAQAQNTYGFRYQKHLQRLAMASAISRGSQVVSKEDVDKVIKLTRYLNLDEAEI